MTDPAETTGASLIASARRDSFQLVAYSSIFVFMLLYVFSVEGAERLLDAHFREQVELAVEAPSALRPISSQIQREIEVRILESPWVRIGGVQVTVIVMGRDGTYLYVGGRVVQPPPLGNDVTAMLREAQRLLPATGEAIVSVPHNTVLSNTLLLVYASLLVQGLFVYNRYASRGRTKQLEQALQVRDEAAQRAAEIEVELETIRHHLSTSAKYYCVMEVDTSGPEPLVTLEVYRVGERKWIEKRAFTWDEINGKKKIPTLRRSLVPKLFRK